MGFYVPTLQQLKDANITGKESGGWNLPSGGNFVNGYYYFSAPKADGGYDFYKATDKDIYSMDYENYANEGGSIPRGESGAQQGTGGTGGSTGLTAEERSFNQNQIDNLNNLLGITSASRDPGLANIRGSYGSQIQQLNEGKTKAMNNYADQDVTNMQNKEKGIGEVGSFANTSYNSLQRILRGAGAGSSSAARSVVPTLVSKSAGTRRQGVFDQAGVNTRDIDMARRDAEDQYSYNIEGLGNAQKGAEKDFVTGLLNRLNDLSGQKQGYQTALGDTAGASATGAEMNSRYGELQSLLGQYIPTYTAKAINLKTPELGKYTLDPGQIRGDQSTPGEYRSYLPMLKKKLQGEY